METEFERSHAATANRFCLFILLAHIPALAAVAAYFHTGVWTALVISALLLSGPVGLFLLNRSSLITSLALAAASMGVSALLIHLSHGMIEMHFHIFTMLALLTVFGSIWPILTAAGTIALHHVTFWLWLPASVFNYKAGFDVVLLHAFFVVFETAPACWIAMRLGAGVTAQGITSEQLRAGAERVNDAATQLNASSRDLSRGAMEQAATLKHTAVSSSQISSLSRQTAERSREAAGFMRQVDDRIAKTNDVLHELTQSMADIGTSSDRIAEIIRVIDEIAFQTNILALNAAVEAARAGQAGLGFAVVAEEVRALAQRSANAAKDTAGLISESMQAARTGNSRLGHITNAVSGISDSVGKVKAHIDDVRDAGEDVSRGIEQISIALSRLDEITHQTAATANENAAAGETLQEQANVMLEIVAKLERLTSQRGK